MPGIDFFRSLGLFAADAFLSEAECADYRVAIRSSALEKASIRRMGLLETVDDTRRKVQIARISECLKSSFQARLEQIRPRIEHHFGVQVADSEVPQFLLYGPGDFYSPHCDSSSDADAPLYVRERNISVVVFLNGTSENSAANGFGGGALMFHGLINEPGFERCAFPLEAVEGRLIAFQSHVLHEVRPVTHGERYTVATWYSGTLNESGNAVDTQRLSHV